MLRILTPSGWSEFDSVQKKSNRKIVQVKNLNCTPDHLIKYKGNFVEARNHPDFIKEIKDKLDVFDVINVKENNEYYTNGLVSHNCEFRGAQNSLVSGSTIDQIVTVEPQEEHDSGLKVYKKVDEKHSYIVLVDSSEGIGSDYHAIVVVDITSEPYEVVCIYHNNELPPLALPSVINNIAQTYNDAYVLIENNSTGGEIGNNLFYDIEYENVLMTRSEKGKQVIGFSPDSRIGVKMSNSVKRLGCSTLKTLIEKSKIILNDQYIVFELGNFVANKSGTYEALEGATDDLIMTLVSFSWLTTQEFFKELVEIDVIGSITRTEEEDDIMPFGLIDNGFSEFDGSLQRDSDNFFLY